MILQNLSQLGQLALRAETAGLVHLDLSHQCVLEVLELQDLLLALTSFLARRVRVRVELGDELGMGSCLFFRFCLVWCQALMGVNGLHLTV